jgi:Na+/melibiose symporter-like transporter
MTGIVLAQLALTVLVYTRTRSPLLSALVFATGFLPQLIAGTLFSALVDRVPARRLLVGCNLVSAVLAAVMAIPATPVAALLVLAFVLGLIRPVFLGARAATLKDVLPGATFVPGRSLVRLVSQGAQIGGFAVSGLLLTAVSPRSILVGNAACFVAAALLLRFGTRERVPVKSTQLSLLSDSLAGLADIMSNAPLRRLLLFSWAVPALSVTPEALAVPYATSLSAGTVGAGVMLTALPAGTLLGEMLTNWKVPAGRQASLVVPAAVLTFIPLLGFAFRPDIPVALVALFCSGLGAAMYLGLDRLIVSIAPEQLLGRALSVDAAGVMFWQGIGYAIAGSLAEAMPITAVIPVAAACGLLSIILYVALGGVRPDAVIQHAPSAPSTR